MGSWSRREGKAPAFEVDTPFPRFFKIVLEQALRHDGKLELPKMAVMEYEDCMGDTILLEVPDGSVWPIKLTKCDGEIWLQQGWPEFAKFYSLKYGFLLLFSYEGEYSHFKVHIFTRNTLEIEYFSSSTEEAEGSSAPSSDTEGQGMKHDRGKSTHGGDYGGTSTPKKLSKAQLRTIAETELEDSKAKAYSRALSFKSDNPSFVMKMHSSYLSNHLPITVPFAKKHIYARVASDATEQLSYVTLQISNERTWPVKCITAGSNKQPRARFQRAGWGPFVNDNHLEEGDACVFEMIDRKGPKMAFKVGIFRVKDEEY